jgi:hypothetical protein
VYPTLIENLDRESSVGGLIKGRVQLRLYNGIRQLVFDIRHH